MSFWNPKSPQVVPSRAHSGAFCASRLLPGETMSSGAFSSPRLCLLPRAIIEVGQEGKVFDPPWSGKGPPTQDLLWSIFRVARSSMNSEHPPDCFGRSNCIGRGLAPLGASAGMLHELTLLSQMFRESRAGQSQNALIGRLGNERVGPPSRTPAAWKRYLYG